MAGFFNTTCGVSSDPEHEDSGSKAEIVCLALTGFGDVEVVFSNLP